MRFLFRFLGSVLFIMVKLFFYLKTYPNEYFDFMEIVAGAFLISVTYSLLIWTIRKGKWWLLLSLITGLFLWFQISYADPGFSGYSSDGPNLMHLIQMIAFVCIMTIADNAFKNSRRQKVFVVLFALIAFGYGFSLFVNGNLIDSSSASTNSGYSYESSSYGTGNYEIADAVFEDLSYDIPGSNSECVRVQYRIWIETDGKASRNDIQALASDLVSEVTSRFDINALSIFVYDGPDMYGSYTVASVDWAPYGDWGRADEVRTGDYSKNSYTIRMR